MMARRIDLTKKLTDEELVYLVDRSRWKDLREYARIHELPPPRLPNAANVRAQEPRVGVKARKLPDVVAELSVAFGRSQQEPGEEQSGESSARDWSMLTVPQLKEELDKRRAQYEKSEDSEGVEVVSYTNEDRKDDLVKKLYDDDAEMAEG